MVAAAASRACAQAIMATAVLALDESGATFGGNIRVEHRCGVLVPLLGLLVVAGAVHRFLTFR